MKAPRITLLPIGAILLCVAAPSADDWTEVDLLLGSPLVVHRQDLDLHHGTACELVTDSFRFDDEQTAGIDIIFSSTGDLSRENPDEKGVSIAIQHSTTDGVGRFVLYSFGFTENWANDFRFGDEIGQELEFGLVWLDNNAFEYQFHDGADQPFYGVVRVEEYRPKYSIVVVRGVRGKIRCRGVAVTQ